MQIIYVDDVFLLNLVINYFILLATAKLCAFPLKRLLFAFSAAVGAVYSVLILIWGFLGLLPIKLCLGIVMVLIAFGKCRHLFKAFCAFLCVSAAFGGAVYAASMLVGTTPGKLGYISLSMRTLAISFAVCYIALTLVFKRLGAKNRRGRSMGVEVVQGGRRAVFRALYDTGNELYDPLSGLPVMVAEAESLRELFPEALLGALAKSPVDFIAEASESGALKTRFRLVLYTSAGASSGLLPVFKPDRLTIDGKPRDDILIGLCPHKLCADGEFSAIL
ncbi:MAG: sigma-E processing peptidase SpoIIGA [Oscillospiraceae bacterium]|jgi:stage II sporulation protein GA (sporulation sigma-E factor processing peptidase)|nr:sigma-E processing peptidase SpoIIGA [Oscillospiraceae bacterium]